MNTGHKSYSIEEARRLTVSVIYGLADDRGIFYVGQTKRPKKRFAAHLSSQGPNKHLVRRIKLAGNALRVVILRLNPHDLNQAEREEIAKRSGLVNLIGGGTDLWTANDPRPWMGGQGKVSPGTWAMRATNEGTGSPIRQAVERMTNAERCGYELALYHSLHPILQKRFSGWLASASDKMRLCINAEIERQKLDGKAAALCR